MADTEKTISRILREGFRHGDKQKISSQLNALQMYLERQEPDMVNQVKWLKKLLK